MSVSAMTARREVYLAEYQENMVRLCEVGFRYLRALGHVVYYQKPPNIGYYGHQVNTVLAKIQAYAISGDSGWTEYHLRRWDKWREALICKCREDRCYIATT